MSGKYGCFWYTVLLIETQQTSKAQQPWRALATIMQTD
jgi:hypothetical protein